MKRPAWVARRIETQKALRALPKCEVPGCTGKAMGIVVLARHGYAMCPRCAQRAQRERT